MQPLLDAVAKVEVELHRKLRLGLGGIQRVLTVDPGVITGVSVLWFETGTGKVLAWAETLITHDELMQVFELAVLLRTLANHGLVHVVIEDFTVAEINMSPEFLSPVRVGRQFEILVFLMARGELGEPVFGQIATPIHWQSRSRKADFDDDRLKVLGFYTPGPDHRRDATRHGLVALKRIKKEFKNYSGPPKRMDWPPEERVSEPERVTSRRFNGVEYGTKLGETPKKPVSKDDLQRMQAEKHARLTSAATAPARKTTRRRKLI